MKRTPARPSGLLRIGIRPMHACDMGIYERFWRRI